MKALIAALALAGAGAARAPRQQPAKARGLFRDRRPAPQGLLKRLTDDLVARAHDDNDRAALCGLVKERHGALVEAVTAESYHEAFLAAMDLTADRRASLSEQCGDEYLEKTYDGRYGLFVRSDGALGAALLTKHPTHRVLSLGDMADLPMASRVDVPMRGFVSPLSKKTFIMDHDETRVALAAENASARADGSMLEDDPRRLQEVISEWGNTTYTVGRKGFMMVAVCHEDVATTNEECMAAHQAEHGNNLREWATESMRTVGNFFEANSRGRSTWFAQMCPVAFAIQSTDVFDIYNLGPDVYDVPLDYAGNCAIEDADMHVAIATLTAGITQCRIKKEHLANGDAEYACAEGWVEEVGAGGDSDTDERAAAGFLPHVRYCTKLDMNQADCELAAAVGAGKCDAIMDQAIFPYGDIPAAVCEWGNPCTSSQFNDYSSPTTGESHNMFTGLLLHGDCPGRYWGGLGMVGSPGSWFSAPGADDIYGQWYAGTLAHELGHNFGAHHANFEQMEYGDQYDVMGSMSDPPDGHFQTAGKRAFGWIDDDEVHQFGPAGCPICPDCTQGGTVQLQSQDTYEFQGNETIGAGASLHYTGTITENWKYDNIPVYIDFTVCEYGGFGWDGDNVHHFTAEVRSRVSDWHRSSLTKDVLQFRWISVSGSFDTGKGPQRVYRGTQFIDITQSTPSQSDGGLSVGDTFVLDLDRSGIVVTFDSKDNEDLYTVTVRYVEPGSQHYELNDVDGNPRVNFKADEVDDPYHLDELMCGSSTTYTLEGGEVKIFKIDEAQSLDPIQIAATIEPVSSGKGGSFYIHTAYPLGLTDFDGSAKNGAHAGGTVPEAFEYQLGIPPAAFEFVFTGQRSIYGGLYILMTDEEVAAEAIDTPENGDGPGAIEIAYKCESGGYWWHIGDQWVLGETLGDATYVPGLGGTCVMFDCDFDDIAGAIGSDDYVAGECIMPNWRDPYGWQDCGPMTASAIFGQTVFVADLREELAAEQDHYVPYSQHNYLSLVNNRADTETTFEFTLECAAIETEHCGPNRYRYGGECVHCPEGMEAPAGSISDTLCQYCPGNSYFSSVGLRCMECPANSASPPQSIGIESCEFCLADQLFTEVSMSNPTACDVIEISGSSMIESSGTWVQWGADMSLEDPMLPSGYQWCGDAGVAEDGTCVQNAGRCLLRDSGVYWRMAACACGGDYCGSYGTTTVCDIDHIREIEDCEWNQEYFVLGELTCPNDSFNGHTMTMSSTYTPEGGTPATQTETLSWGNAVGKSASARMCLAGADDGNVEITVGGGTTDGSELTWEIDFCSGNAVGSGTGAGDWTVAHGVSCGIGDAQPPSPTPEPTGLPVPAPTPAPVPTAVPIPAPTVSLTPTPQPTYPLPTPSPCMEITLMDSYGDGWSGNYMVVYDCDGNELSEGDGLTLDGWQRVVELCVPPAKGYLVKAFAAGTSPQENSWSIVHPDGMELIDQGIPFDGMLGECFATDAPSAAPTPRPTETPTPRPTGAPTPSPTVSLSPTPSPVQVDVSVVLTHIAAEEFDEPCGWVFSQAMVRACSAVLSEDQVVILQVTDMGRRLGAGSRRLDDGAGIEIRFAIIPPESADEEAGHVWMSFAAASIQEDIVADRGESLIEAIVIVAAELAEETGDELVALATAQVNVDGLDVDAFVPEPTAAPTATVSLLEEVEALAENSKAAEDYTGSLVGAFVGISVFWGICFLVYKKFFKGGKLRSTHKRQKLAEASHAAQMDEMHRMVRQMSSAGGLGEVVADEVAGTDAGEAKTDADADGSEVVAADSVGVAADSVALDI